MTKPLDPKEMHGRLHALKQKHGHGRAADKAMLQEALAMNDLPQFIRGRMQMAMNRHVQMERMEAHDKFMSKVTT